jgi:uncharacterized protein (TIGR01777 family)
LRILVTGATGLIGRRLVTRLLARGDSVLPLSRKAVPPDSFGPGRCEPLHGDPAVAGPWLESIAHCDAVIHLAGEPVLGRRWNAAVLKQLHDSRVESTKQLADALAAQPLRADGTPKAFLSASAVGIYGADTGDAEQTESSPHGSDELAEICIAWEAAAEPAREAGVRVVHPRTGIVLDPEGGALPKMLLPFKLFAGGRIGSGRQYVPWIHRDDMTDLLLHLLDNPDCRGPFNCCSPNPEINSELSRVLGIVLHRPNWLPVPRLAIRVLLGKVADVVVGGQRATPPKALGTGFAFRFPNLEAALRDLLNRPSTGRTS